MTLTRHKSRLSAIVVVALACMAQTAYADEPPGVPTEPTAPTATDADGMPADPAMTQMRAHHRRGIELYDEGDFRLALVEFERAYAISGNYKILFNIGQVHYELRSYAKARLAFEQYLERGGERIDPARRADVERDLATLRTRTATLTVRANVPDAEIAVDDKRIGRAPIEAAIVDAGIARLKATRPGYDVAIREVTLAGGDVQTVNIDLQATKRDVIVTQTTTGLPASVVAGWIITGVLAAGTVGTAIAANAAHSEYEQQRHTPISGSPAEARSELERQRDLVGGLAVTTDVLAIATLVAGGVSLYLTLREPKRDGPRASAALGGAPLRIRF